MEQRQMAVLGIGLVLLVVGGLFAMSTFGTTVLGPSDAVTRELPDNVAPGDALTARLQFNLSEPQTVTVHETISGAVQAEETRTVQNAKNQMIFYRIDVPADASGRITFSGTVEDSNIRIGGDTVVEVEQ